MKKICLFSLLFIATIQLNAQTWDEVIKLGASDVALSDIFAYDVSISGDYAIVGAPWDDDNGSNSGSAYIFINEGETWVEVTKLTASDADLGDRFGSSVEMYGDHVIISAAYNSDDGTSSGSAYIFNREGDAWTETAKLTASDPGYSDYFGNSVSIGENHAVIGAFNDDDLGFNAGSAYVFEYIDETWTEVAKLNASDASGEDWFGQSVSIYENRIIVGATGNDDGGEASGSAYIFELEDGIWTEVAKLTAVDSESNDFFGTSVALSGDFALIGASHASNDFTDNSGAAYIFEKTGDSWIELTKLVPSDASPSGYFGFSVSIDENQAIVGAQGNAHAGIDTGSAYIFENTDGIWSEVVKLVASDAFEGDHFGQAVAMDGNRVIIGAHGNDDFDINSGSCYIFDKCLGFEVTANATDTLVCEGELITLTGEYADTYTWDMGIANDEAFSPPVGSTTYTVTGMDEYGCTNTDEITITVIEEIAITYVTTPELFGGDAAIDITVTGGTPTYSFDWDTDEAGDFDDEEDLTGIVAGTYTIVVEGATKCSGSAIIDVVNELSLAETKNESISIYPNPAQNIFTISTNGNFVYELTTLNGKLVQTGAALNKETIDISYLSQGLYYILIRSDEKVNTIKLIKR